MSSTTVEKAALEIATQAIGPATATLTAFDNAVEDQLARIDEVSALIDSVRHEVAHTVDTAFPMLLQNTQELTALFAVLDRTEEAVNRGFAAAKSTAERLESLQAGYDTKYPEGIAKFTASWFGGKTRVADAPVKLPAWDPASGRLQVDADVAALVAAVGGPPQAVQAEMLSAFIAESDEGVTAEEEVTAEEAGSGSEQQKNIISDSEGSGASIATTVVTAPRVIASGEDDEEEDDDDD